MVAFTPAYGPEIIPGPGRTYYFVLKYAVLNFNTTACTVPVPTSEPMLLNRVVWIDHVDVRYTQSSTSYDPVKAYLSIYPLGSAKLGQQKDTRLVDWYDKYLIWRDINQWVVMTDPSTYFAAIACTGYTATDDMHCRIIGHFELTDEEMKQRERERA